MKRFSLIYTLFAFCILGALPLKGQNAMRQLMSSPEARMDTVFLGLDKNTRLDMIDYFDGGYKNFSEGPFRSSVRLDSLDDRHAHFVTETALSVDAYLVTLNTDSIVVYVVDVPIDNGDAIVTLRSVKDGAHLGFVAPDYSDWLVKDALKKVPETKLLTAIPFVTSKVAVDPAAATIVFTNSSIAVPGLDKEIIEVFKPTVTYKWTGKGNMPVRQ